MISRVAENLYWLQRYVERAGSTARLLGTASAHTFDLAGVHPWSSLLVVTGEHPRFHERFGDAASEDGALVCDWLTWSPDCPASLWSSVRAARENARVTRETVSREVFEILNHAWLWLDTDDARRQYQGDPQGFFLRIRGLSHEVHGAALDTMLRDEPLEFLELGMYLERAGQTARVLDIRHHLIEDADLPGGSVDAVAWIHTLLGTAAYEGFFKRHRAAVKGSRVAAFLLLDPDFPRSVRFCLREACGRLEAIRPDDRSLDSYASGRALAGLAGRLDTSDVRPLLEAGIHDALTEIVDGLAEASGHLYDDFFDPVASTRASHTEPSQ